MRRPVAYGFYPFDPIMLKKKVEECFLDKEFGPGYIPKERKNEKKLIAGIAPHAGYDYSGPCAAFLYKEMYENWEFETVIIFGTNHSGLGENISILVTENWETPIGIIETDKEFGKLLIKNTEAVEDPIPHVYEHSIEVQLPFLQYISRDVKIVPILLKDLEISEIREFVKAIKEIADDLNRRIFVLSSSDLTHHGEIYGYVIFKENPIEKVRELDLQYIEKILSLDSKGFLELIEKYNGTVCGVYPILGFIEYSRLFKPKVKLLKYYNSGEKTKDESIIVGYASIISHL